MDAVGSEETLLNRAKVFALWVETFLVFALVILIVNQR
jgi:hypothetical protein